MNCKICGDPIYNKYAHRWFHTWKHDHWAVREDQQISKCIVCEGIIHYNDNRWWHIKGNNDNHIACPSPEKFKNNYIEENNMTNCKKCNEEIVLNQKTDKWHHV